MKVPRYNGEVLKWARERRGISREAAAAKLGKSKKPEDIERWENNIGGPTVQQARKLAALYGRPFLEFFLPQPPSIEPVQFVPDFRMRAGFEPPPDSIEAKEIQEWAAAQRINALDLYEELSEEPLHIPSELFTQTSSDPEAAARLARTGARFSIAEQFNIPNGKDYLLPNILRRKLESLGIITLRVNRLKAFSIRGICLAEFPLPVIVFSDEAPAAQAFTLVHELAHVLTRESGITGPRDSTFRAQPVERWCDRFAAAFLMPSEQLTTLLGEKPASPAQSVGDATLETTAKRFRVSPHAMLIRLVQLGYVVSSYYWDVKKPEFDEQDRHYRKFGRAEYYGTRYRGSLGDLYTRLVIEAWERGRITNHNAAEYMGIKNFAHLNDIRDRILSS